MWGRGPCWIGVCALALGLSILIVAIFPVGGLMFLVAMLLIACGVCCVKRYRERGGERMKIVVVKSPRILRGLLCRVFGIHA